MSEQIPMRYRPELKSKTTAELVMMALEDGLADAQDICGATGLEIRSVCWNLMTLEHSGAARMNGQNWEIVRDGDDAAPVEDQEEQ